MKKKHPNLGCLHLPNNQQQWQMWDKPHSQSQACIVILLTFPATHLRICT